MEQTKEQLQKEIMEILYTKSLVKPVWVTCSEVYWNIQNIKVTERSVREALDWLVKNEVVLYQGDKYQINKREFIEMSKRKAMEEKEMSQETSPQPENTGMNDNKTEIRNAGTDTTATVRKNYLFYVIIALIAFLLSGILIGILCFNHYAQKEDITPPIIERQDSLSIQEMKISTMGYIKDEYTINRNFKNVTQSLKGQQEINQELLYLIRSQQEQINSLAEYNRYQTRIIEQNQRENHIYLWIIGITTLIASSLLIALYGKRN